MTTAEVRTPLDEDLRALGWELVHAEICRLARQKNAYEVDEAKWLLAAWKTRVHEPLGFGSFYEYVDRVLGYSRRFVAERLRVARALADLPQLCAAVRRGDIPWSAARELSRVATEDTVDAWIESARGETVRDIERAVAGRQPGDLPTDPPDEAVRRHRVRFEVQGETLALLRAAQEKLLVDAGGHVDDDAVVQAMARAVLDRDADDDTGRAAYQLCLHECVRCGAAHAEGGGELVPVDAAVLEAARCDAQENGRVDGGGGETHVGGAGGAPDAEGAFDEKTHVGARGAPRRRRGREAWPSPTRQSRIAAAMRALRGLGRTERDAKQLVDRVAAHVGPRASAADLLRLATAASGWAETCHR